MVPYPQSSRHPALGPSRPLPLRRHHAGTTRSRMLLPVRGLRALVGCSIAAALIASPVIAKAQVGSVPTPASHFGFTPGENRKLATWDELLGYYEKVASASPRVTIDTLGTTTLGRPMVMLTVTSPENHGRLNELHATHLRLADPRTVTNEAELAALKEEARTIVLVTSQIHSTEVGAGQMPPNLLYELASSHSPDVLQILNEVVLLLVPSLNPDGTQMVSEWYRRFVGTPFEGREPISLYHHYIGHDNNRDWYAFTQVETQLTVERAHNVWRPVIVHDVHQMGSSGARIFVPPYVEPFEANVDPLIIAAINQLGSYMAAEMTSQGKTGVVTGAQYDLFTPARAYQHYHGGVRILSETASASLATPIVVRDEQLSGARGYEARQPSMNYPAPWLGGEWGLPQIVDYQQSGVMALLKNAARNRRFWIDNFYEINRRAVEKWPSWPQQWVIPAGQPNQVGVDAVLRILTMGSVEVRQAERPFTAAGATYPAGSYVIPMNQPYASWAQTMLEPQSYPDLRDYPGGPPTRPYDVTAHTLPLLMAMDAVPVDASIDVPLSEPIPTIHVDYRAPANLSGSRAPRVALYKGWRESMPAGWTRWVFDQHEIAYDSIHDADIRRGDLNDRYDVIIFQDQSASQIRDGWREGQQTLEYTGGVGEAGLLALRDFVQRGGRIIAVETATDFAIDLFGLPIANRVDGLSAENFFIPGSILRLDVDTSHAIGSGTAASSVAWFWRSSRAFDVQSDSGARVIARYGAGDPRISGWVLGAEHVAGQPAIVEVPVGAGSLVLFGFQPNYRGQTIATWPLLFNAMAK
jgi:hypothetical protein